jgi:glycosyltransferase involved in cell wall biosynthesis
MLVTALTAGLQIPSARFRVRQHIETLRLYGIEVNEYAPLISQSARLPGALGRIRLRYLPPLALGQLVLNCILRIPGTFSTHKSNLTWIQRRYIPYLDSAAFLTKAPRVLDVDDAIWDEGLYAKHSAATLARRVDAVVAGNQYLANWYSQYCRNVYVVPTAIDCDRFLPAAGGAAGTSETKDSFVIGWTGSWGNLCFLETIERPLARFLRQNPNARIRVICDSAPTLSGIDIKQVEFLRWSPETESKALQDVDVGIMPLEDTNWTKGKCSFKMLQYMATGIPSIVSPVGMNVEILKLGPCGLAATTDDNWFDALQTLYTNKEASKRMGNVGRALALEHFSTSQVSKQLAEIFRKTLSGK